MSSEYRSAWQIIGMVVGRRELTSPKNPSWRGYVAKVATIGSTFEVNVTADTFGMLMDQVAYDFSGRFEDRSGRLTLIADRIKPLPEPAARSAVAEVGSAPRRNS
jgi:hypothetical protein